MSNLNPAIEEYGWSAVPRKTEILLAQSEAAGNPKAMLVSSIDLPKSPLAKAVFEYAKKELAPETFNHSMRVFYFGQAILAHAFPSWSSPIFNETYFLTSLLHDIGATESNLSATLMSFEFYGGFLSLEILKRLSAPTAQAESVVETIIRHQDLGDTGSLTKIGALIQLATIFDNMGGNPQLVSTGTTESVVGAYPRNRWSSCFARTLRAEVGMKPWSHTTHIPGFAEGVEQNNLMAPYDA